MNAILKNIFRTACCLALFSSFSYAQKFEITGVIKDSITSKPIVYGKVYLKTLKDSVIAKTLTDVDGNFKIASKYKNDCKLCVSALTYSEHIIAISSIELTRKLVLKPLFLAQNVLVLKEFSVENNEKAVETKYDRKVFNVTEQKANASQSILDILRTLPGVTVDENNSVLLRGRGVEIYVDDQPSDFLYPDIIQIPVERVFSVEIVDATLAGKHGADFINVKLRKILFNGLNGYLSANTGGAMPLKKDSINLKNTHNEAGYANLNYKYKKFLFYVNTGASASIDSMFNKKNGTYYSNSKLFNSNSFENEKSTFQIYRTTLGSVYSSNKTKITLGGALNPRYSEIFDLGSSSAYSANNNTKSLSTSFDKNLTYYNRVGLYFTHKFDSTEKRLEGNVILYNNPHDATSISHSTVLANDNGFLFFDDYSLKNISNMNQNML